MIDFKRIPLEVITEQSDDLIKQIENQEKKSLSFVTQKVQTSKSMQKKQIKKNLKTSQINLK